MSNCHQLKMPATDGKSYLTDAADAETCAEYIEKNRTVPFFFASPLNLREEGFEPSRPCGHTVLSRARLPVPPPARQTILQNGANAFPQ